MSAVRRVLLALALTVACGGEQDGGGAPPAERPWSVQLHVHGPFSEGSGSIDSHSRQARDLGLDVLWWSDHDFRITSYRHVARFGFEGPSEPLDRGEAWSALTQREARGRKRIRPAGRDCGPASAAEFVAGGAAEGERSLRLAARGDGPDFAGCLHALSAERKLATRPLASQVEVALEVRLEDAGDDARAVVEIQLSEHALADGPSLEPLVLRYAIGTAPPGEPVREGRLYTVFLRAEQGGWASLRLPVSQDAARGFPEVEAGDNSLHRIAVGVEARRGAVAAARFDALRIEQQITGPAAFDAQRELVERVARQHPGLVQLQGVELSYELRHLNAFGAEPLRLDYDALFRESGFLSGDPPRLLRKPFRTWATRRAIELAHARGEVVSYNHMFGVGVAGAEQSRSVSEVIELLTAQRIFGADLLEVGYRNRGGHDLDDHLGVWDELARRGLRPVGVGVSDSHGGRWSEDPNNFVSWVYAPAPERGALVEGLRRGRVFFGDLSRFDGTLDLRTARGAAMGQIVVTEGEAEEVQIEATGLVPGDQLVVLVAGEPVARHVAQGESLRVAHALALPPGEDTFVRVELRDAQGEPRAFSNPIHFVRPAHAADLPAARALRDAPAP